MELIFVFCLPSLWECNFIFLPNYSVILWTQNLDFATWCLNANQEFGGTVPLMADVLKFLPKGLLELQSPVPEGFHRITESKAQKISSSRTVLTALSTYCTTQEEGREALLTDDTDLHQLPWCLHAVKRSFVLCSYVRWGVTQQRGPIKAWRGCWNPQLCSWQSAHTLLGFVKYHFPEGNQLSLIFVRGTSWRSGQGSVLDYH